MSAAAPGRSRGYLAALVAVWTVPSLAFLLLVHLIYGAYKIDVPPPAPASSARSPACSPTAKACRRTRGRRKCGWAAPDAAAVLNRGRLMRPPASHPGKTS